LKTVAFRFSFPNVTVGDWLAWSQITAVILLDWVGSVGSNSF
jgi:hypothetical protein